MVTRRDILGGAAALVASRALPVRAQGASPRLSIGRQRSILHLPTHVMERQRLVEAHARRLGLGTLSVDWVWFGNGGAQQTALSEGDVDIVNTGTAQLLLLWDSTGGQVKGIVATSAQPVTLVSRDERIRSIADFMPGDRIAVPTVKLSTQAILLQMAAARQWGADAWGRLDPLTVQMTHSEALAAMEGPAAALHNHFGAPPYDFYELKGVPSAHAVLRSPDVIGGPLSQTQFMTTVRYAEANPNAILAVRAALEEAVAWIVGDVPAAIALYREATGDPADPGLLAEMLAQPGMMQWGPQPQGTMVFAQHLARIGSLRHTPKAWTDYYLPVAHDLAGS